jgi:hypothetical protein
MADCPFSKRLLPVFAMKCRKDHRDRNAHRDPNAPKIPAIPMPKARFITGFRLTPSTFSD